MAKILVVDDEQTIIQIICRLLETDQHESIPAFGGDVALDILGKECDFDLVITDIRMQPVDGMQVLEYLHKNHPNVSVIMLTAYGQVDTAIRAMEMGAYDYIKKPFRADHLMSVVNKALEYGHFMKEESGQV